MSQYFPGYQQPYTPQFQSPAPRFQQPLQSYMQPQESIIRVTGMEGAKAYPVAPNSRVALFDDGRDVFYIKAADAGGYPTLAAYSFAPLQENAPASPDYVTRAEFEELKEMITNGIKPVRKAKQPAADADE